MSAESTSQVGTPLAQSADQAESQFHLAWDIGFDLEVAIIPQSGIDTPLMQEANTLSDQDRIAGSTTSSLPSDERRAGKPSSVDPLDFVLLGDEEIAVTIADLSDDGLLEPGR
jgi:hypothetical protein